ncbi:hypothetical protein ONZ45_g9313 [Pleurotus djamor]|nr:hypothetical protein ONZ45_g9313 [Pleurotus djamor]
MAPKPAAPFLFLAEHFLRQVPATPQPRYKSRSCIFLFEEKDWPVCEYLIVCFFYHPCPSPWGCDGSGYLYTPSVVFPVSRDEQGVSMAPSVELSPLSHGTDRIPSTACITSRILTSSRPRHQPPLLPSPFGIQSFCFLGQPTPFLARVIHSSMALSPFSTAPPAPILHAAINAFIGFIGSKASYLYTLASAVLLRLHEAFLHVSFRLSLHDALLCRGTDHIPSKARINPHTLTPSRPRHQPPPLPAVRI